MKLSNSIVLLGSLIPFASAHFWLVYPDSRKRVEQNMPIFPCGGSPPTVNRTLVPLDGSSFPVALRMGHTQTAVEVLLALGTDPGDNFNITLVHTFGVQGLGPFCLPHVSFDPAVLGTHISDGMNATLQVQTNGDTGGGLYACADIQFSSTTTYSEPSSCKNNTGVTAIAFSEAVTKLNANETTAEGQPQDPGQAQTQTQSSSPTSSQTGSSTSQTSTPTPSAAGAASLQTVATWGLLGAVIAGGVAVL